MIRRLTEREQKIFIACLVMVVLSVFYNGLARPLKAKADFLRQEISIRQSQLERDRGAIQASKVLDEQYDIYAWQFHQPGTEEEAASSILSEIEKVAGKLGLHVTDLKPKRIERNEHNNQFSVSLTISSELVDIVRFLYTLQQAPHLFDVEEIEFEKLVRRKESVMTTRLVLGKVFVSLDPDSHREASDGEASLPELVLFKTRPFEVYAKGIETRDLFQSLRDKLKPDAKVMEKALPALHKRIKLIGILLDQDSKAIVEDLKEKQTHFLSRGESVGTAFLEDIQEDKVIFMYNNERIEMAP